MKREILQLRSIQCQYKGLSVLQQLSFSIFEGEIISILGLPGAGKSVLAKMIAGIIPYDAGSYCFCGYVDRINNVYEAQKKGIFMVGSESAVIETLSVGENMLLTCYDRSQGMFQAEKATAYVKDLLEQSGFDWDINMPARMLSYSARIMLEIYRAIFSNARLLVLNQVLGILSVEERHMLADCLRTWRRKGVSFLILECTDYLPLDLADRILFMRDGQITMEFWANEYSREVGIDILQRWLRADTDSLPNLKKTEIGNPLLLLTDISQASMKSTMLYQGEVIGLHDNSLVAEVVAGHVSSDGIVAQPYQLKLTQRQYQKWATDNIAWVSQSFIDWGSTEKMSVLGSFVCCSAKHRKYFITEKFTYFLYQEFSSTLGLRPEQWEQPVWCLPPRDRLKVRLYQIAACASPIWIIDMPRTDYQKMFYQEIVDFVHWGAAHGKLMILTPPTTEWLSSLCTRFLCEDMCEPNKMNEINIVNMRKFDDKT